MAREYLWYFLERTDRHSLQTPFAYALYGELREYHSTHRKGDPSLEFIRSRLTLDDGVVAVKDEGAGSNYSSAPNRSIASICAAACSSLPYNLLYQFLVSRTRGQVVLELGTSLGINTGYLAVKTSGSVYTFEAESALLEIARGNLNAFSNITFISGLIRDTLPAFLKTNQRIDYIQLDAHHTYEATMHYCGLIWPFLHEDSIVVIGDIHWSSGMKAAWKEIKTFPGVSASMDFFECGVLFFKRGIQLEHHILYYPHN